jgi:DeoR family transcriptional regulator of aga operon
VIVVADSTKIGHVSPALICPISAVHVLVTDYGISDEAYNALIERGIRVVRA